MSKYNNEFVKGVLRTQGTRFVNEDGQEIILHGYGLANWENVEGFMIGGAPTPVDVFKFWLFPGPGKDHNPERWTCRRTVSQVIRELCGSKYLETFWDRWEENHLQEADIKLMADLGYNCARIVLNANALLYEEPGINFNEKGFGRLANVIDWCEKYKLYVILDMHGVVGGNNGATGDSLFCEYPSVFLDAESKERQIILWEEIVRRFGSRWIIAGYDLINEPVSSPVQHEYIHLLTEYYDECIERIRKIDTEHIFFLEGAKYARDMRIFDKEFDPEYHKWAISIHLYGASPEIKDLYPWLLLCQERNVPLWLGECGAGEDADAIFYDICAHYGVAYTPWAYKTALGKHGPHGGKPGSVGHPLPQDWNKIIDYLMTGPRPSYEESQRIMDEYIELTKLEHCVINYDHARTSARKPNITLAGVGYDMWTEDGSRYYGNWEMGNYLCFRLEDRTKLVWATDKTKPYPKFTWYEDKAELRYSPLHDLALELAAGEYANYTVREVEDNCKVAVEGVGEGKADILCNGVKAGEITLAAGCILQPVWSEEVTIPAGAEVVVKVAVTEGTLTIKNVRFQY
ncbi:MAG: cellulase family glycosylhydrolase [Lachnospiraceae bacterium]|nr:cellulase family glycosylhydrolase [Lachnospiraceae bacterium]